MKTEPIELFGEKFLLSERTAQQCLETIGFIQENTEENDSILGIYVGATVLSDSLQYNIKKLPRWRVLRRRKLKKLFDQKSLIKNLAPSELRDISKMVYILEGANPAELEPDFKAPKRDLKKKSVETSQKH